MAKVPPEPARRLTQLQTEQTGKKTNEPSARRPNPAFKERNSSLTGITPGRVSVIIPAFNAEAYIAEAIESVIGQTYPDVECIVVDDGSTDRTGEVVETYGERIQHIRQPNSGPSVARNRGIETASGEYIGFLDADDVYFKHKLEHQVSLLEHCPKADAAICDCVLTNVQGIPLGRLFSHHPIIRGIAKSTVPGGHFLEESIFPYLLLDAFFYTGALLIRRRALSHVGGYDESLTWHEDLQFHLRLACALNFVVADEALFAVRLLRPGSLTTQTTEKALAGLALYRSLREAIPELPREFRRLIREREGRYALETGLQMFYHPHERGQTRAARKMLRQALRQRFGARTLYYCLMAHIPQPALHLARSIKSTLAGRSPH